MTKFINQHEYFEEFSNSFSFIICTVQALESVFAVIYYAGLLIFILHWLHSPPFLTQNSLFENSFYCRDFKKDIIFMSNYIIECSYLCEMYFFHCLYSTNFVLPNLHRGGILIEQKDFCHY